jgi:hypothetical protein
VQRPVIDVPIQVEDAAADDVLVNEAMDESSDDESSSDDDDASIDSDHDDADDADAVDGDNNDWDAVDTQNEFSAFEDGDDVMAWFDNQFYLARVVEVDAENELFTLLFYDDNMEVNRYKAQWMKHVDM